MKHYALIILILVLVASGGGFLLFRDNTAPTLKIDPAAGGVSAARPLTLSVTDDGAGLKNIRAVVTQDGQTSELANAGFERGTASQEMTLSLADAQLKNGPLTVQITTEDHAFFSNSKEYSFAFDFDSRPPVVSVISTAHNLYRGGSALVLYKVSEEVERTGVQVGDLFFPGYMQDKGYYACLFAFPYDMEKNAFVPKVVAVDQAGNERKAGFYYHTNDRPQNLDRLNISQAFLDAKMPEFQDHYPGAENMLDIFLKVNREMRVQNREKLKEFAHKTATAPLWQGTFLRLPNAANRAKFAERRTYLYGGNEIDQQTHLGLDLASLANSPVPAANLGDVVFADDLGIYGLCVLIDHGLGLQTLYAHLSSIDTNVGDRVEKGQIIGRTGATGMAGGDHLHYEVIVSGLPVSPFEWWDSSWIQNNFTSKWEAAMTP